MGMTFLETAKIYFLEIDLRSMGHWTYFWSQQHHRLLGLKTLGTLIKSLLGGTHQQFPKSFIIPCLIHLDLGI